MNFDYDPKTDPPIVGEVMRSFRVIIATAPGDPVGALVTAMEKIAAIRGETYASVSRAVLKAMESRKK